MNSKDLYNAIGKLDDDILEQSETPKKKSSWLKWGAAAACLCLCVIGAVSVFHPKGDRQDSEAHAIAALEFNGCYYEVCDVDWVLERYGLPDKITAEMAGEHIAYLKYRDSVKFEETAAPTDMELFQYAPSPCNGVYVVRDGTNYMAALFCNFRQFDSNTNMELSELYRTYGINNSEDIAAIAHTKSLGEIESVIGNIVTDSEIITEFYELTTSLISYGNEDFQAIVFDNIPETDRPAAHTAFANDAITIRVETQNGLRFKLQVYPSYGWIYAGGTMSYYQMDESISDWFREFLH